MSGKLDSNTWKLKQLKIIKRKEDELKQHEAEILRLNDAIKTKTKVLKEKYSYDHGYRVAQSRLKTHRTDLAVDASKRPPDRTFDIRQYTLSAKDTWKFEDLRSWYDRYAPDNPEEYRLIPSQTGYCLRTEYGFNDAK